MIFFYLFFVFRFIQVNKNGVWIQITLSSRSGIGVGVYCIRQRWTTRLCGLVEIFYIKNYIFFVFYKTKTFGHSLWMKRSVNFILQNHKS